MRRIVFLALLTTFGTVHAQQYVPGYCRADGRCVQGHFKTKPNGTALDNYSVEGNWNPNTGKVSMRKLEVPSVPKSQDGLSDPRIQIGPRGGRYYISETGQRIYVKDSK